MLLAAVALVAGAAGPPEHPMSVSHLQFELEAERIRLEMVLQVETLLEVPALDGLDLDQDGALDEAELNAGWELVRGYLEPRLALSLDGEAADLAFDAWAFGGGSSELVGEVSDRFSWLTLRGGASAAGLPRSVEVHSDLFFDDGNPDHRSFVALAGLAGPELYGLLSRAERACDFRSAPLRDYLAFGYEHVLEGIDHLAFVLALLFGVGGLRALLGAVTAFTLAHTLTLGCSALGLFSLPAAVVEPGIALSVALVLWLHLAQGTGRARPWLPALAFGLLHGFGFAGALGEVGLPPHARLTALLGFNLGVEAGQLVFVLPVALVAGWAARHRPSWRPVGRRTGGVLLGALAFVLCGEVIADRWMDAAAVPWAAPVAAAGVAALLALPLRGRRSPEGFPLAPMLGSALLLALSYAAGRALSGL